MWSPTLIFSKIHFEGFARFLFLFNVKQKQKKTNEESKDNFVWKLFAWKMHFFFAFSTPSGGKEHWSKPKIHQTPAATLETWHAYLFISLNYQTKTIPPVSKEFSATVATAYTCIQHITNAVATANAPPRCRARALKCNRRNTMSVSAKASRDRVNYTGVKPCGLKTTTLTPGARQEVTEPNLGAHHRHRRRRVLINEGDS